MDTIQIAGDPGVWARLGELLGDYLKCIERAGQRDLAELLQRRQHEVPSNLASELDEARLCVLVAGGFHGHNGYCSEEELALASGYGESIIREWCRIGGPAFAMRAVKTMRRWGAVSLCEGGLRPAKRKACLEKLSFGVDACPESWMHCDPWPWRVLRDVLRGASSSAAHEQAELWIGEHAGAKINDICIRCVAAYLFPQERGWADEAFQSWLPIAADTPTPPEVAQLLAAGITAEQACKVIEMSWLKTVRRFLDEALAVHGDALAPGLARLVEHQYAKDDTLEAAAYLMRLEGPQAGAELAKFLEEPYLRAQVSDYFMKRPALAVQTLVGIVENPPPPKKQGGLGLAAAAKTILAKLHAKGVDVPGLFEEAAGPAASVEQWPEVLRNPPWRAKKRPAALPVRPLEPLQGPERVHFAAAEREKLFVRPSGRNEERARNHLRNVCKTMEMLHSLPDDEEVFALLQGDGWEHLERNVRAMLARFGDRLAPRATTMMLEHPCPDAVFHLESPRLAALVADYFAAKKYRGEAAEWLVRFPETAALGLIPPALNKHAAAQHALRYVAAGYKDLVLSVAQRYDAKAEVEAVLAFDPLWMCPAKPPKLPEFWDPTAFPSLELKAGGTLPATAVDLVGEMLQFAPYVGLGQVREACTRESLDRFVWALFQAWLLAGAPGKHQWALMALGHLGGDEVARDLVPMLRKWPNQGSHARAVMGLQALAYLGTDFALRALFEIGKKAGKGLREAAQEKIDEVARWRGLDAEDLADRLIPELGLERDGTCHLEDFQVGFDQNLLPLAELPGDAPANLQVRWKDLKRDAKAVASEQIKRLETAMVRRRRWRCEDWTQLFQRHPLMLNLARRLVWGHYGETFTPFRVCEDNTLADAEDGRWELPSDGWVGLAHPSELRLPAWNKLFTDYELAQPFAQLSRPVYGSDTPDSWTGRTVALGSLLGLERRGWVKDVDNYYSFSAMIKDFGHHRRAELRFRPSAELGNNKGEHKVVKVDFDEALDDAQRSELFFDLAGLKAWK